MVSFQYSILEANTSSISSLISNTVVSFQYSVLEANTPCISSLISNTVVSFQYSVLEANTPCISSLIFNTVVSFQYSILEANTFSIYSLILCIGNRHSRQAASAAVYKPIRFCILISNTAMGLLHWHGGLYACQVMSNQIWLVWFS